MFWTTYIRTQQSSIAQYLELFTVTRLTAQHLRLQFINEDLIKAQVTSNTVINCMHKLEDAIFLCILLVAAGTVVGIFVMLALSLLCTCAVVFIKKSRRVKGTYISFYLIYLLKLPYFEWLLWTKVSAIGSRILEHKSSTTSKKCDVKNEKGILGDKMMHTCSIPAKLNSITIMHRCC